MSGRHPLAAVLIAVGLGMAGGALAAPPDDRVTPPEQYSTEKARRLAITHQKALRELNADVYHCLPWVETTRYSIGFFRPKGAVQDDRYLSIRLYIEQEPTPEFARLGIERRASAMFSRYVGAMLRRMTSDRSLLNDPALDGFMVTLEWMKQAAGPAGGNPIHESIATWIDRRTVGDYLASRIPVTEMATRAQILAWDGETALGPLRLAVWDDDFVATYKVANYQPEPGASCR